LVGSTRDDGTTDEISVCVCLPSAVHWDRRKA
jgi:hypothetical protein